MLRIVIPESEDFNNETGEFITNKECVLQLEHSLVSVSKWESKWNKAFLSNKKHTYEETIDYIRCMTINNVPDNIYSRIRNADIDKVNEYISAPMTAVYFHDDKSGKTPGGDTITSELIYYWMIVRNIPFECQKWHLNRLLALIRVYDMKNSPNKKMSAKEIARRNKAINAARRKRHNSKG